MAKVTSPFFALSASGQLGQAFVNSRWRGIPYVRAYVTPANPQTAAQTLTRNTFGWLTALYRYLPATVTAGWTAYAAGKALTARNSWLKFNVGVLRSETDLTNLVMSPSVGSGPVASSLALVAGSTQITATLVQGTLPVGWSIVQAHAAAVLDQDPQTETAYTVTAAVDATDPYDVVLTSLTASVLYHVSAWFEYLKPDGSTAYGPAIMDTETPTA